MEKLGHRGKHLQGRFRLKQNVHLKSDVLTDEPWDEWNETAWIFFPAAAAIANNSPKKSRGSESSSPKGTILWHHTSIRFLVLIESFHVRADKPSRKRSNGAADLGFEPSAAAGDGEDAIVTRKSRTNEASKAKKKSRAHEEVEEDYPYGAAGASSSSAGLQSGQICQTNAVLFGSCS